MTDEQSNTSDEYSRSARRADARRQPKTSRWPAWMNRWPMGLRIAFVSLTALAVLIGVVAGVDVALSAGKIHPGVHVGGVDVGGMARDVAAVRIVEYVSSRSTAPVVLQMDDQQWEIAAETVGLSVDSTALAEAAYGIGRGEFLRALSERLRAVAGGLEVPLELALDEEAWSSAVAGINDAIAQPAIDAGVVVDGASVTRTEASDGLGVDAGNTRSAMLEAFVSDVRTVPLELVPLTPEIDAEHAEDAYQSALAMVSAPVELYYEDKQWTVQPDIIGGWIGFRKTDGPDGAALEAYIVSEEVSATILPLVAEVGKPARDASFSVSNGAVSIVPAEDGLAADAEDLAGRLTTVLTGTGERRCELTMRRVEPALSTEDAKGLGIVERLSTFTTEYSSSNKPRVNNIHTLADALDGTLLAPGETFSFNGTVGERTAAKGYQEAPAIVNGKLVPQLGGGICQVNTTLFNAVFFSGLPVVERHNHSQYISHYPKGRDATVSWGGPDFKFTNDTPNWVLIATGYSNSSVTISLYGTDPGYEVTYETGAFTNIVNPPIREVKDPTMPTGTRVIEERGVSGRTIVVTRIVTKGGAEIRRDSFKSVYRASEEVVRVGTMPPAVPSVPTTDTTP